MTIAQVPTSPTVLPSVLRDVESKVQQMFDYIIAQGDADYIGERVSQLQHSLQCAALAQKANADDETILGALLHDVGRFIPAAKKREPMIWEDGTNVGIHSHEVVGEHYLRELGFSEKICQLVGAHVSAKRYLTAVDQAYYEGLSESSKRTLKFQGGPFNEQQVKEAQKDPWLQDKLSVRRWDDLAKDPDTITAPLSTYWQTACTELLKSRSQFRLCGKSYDLPANRTAIIRIDSECLDPLAQTDALPSVASAIQKGLHIDDEAFRTPEYLNRLERSGLRVALVTVNDKQQHCSDSTLPSYNRIVRERHPNNLSISYNDLLDQALAAGIELTELDEADFVYLDLSNGAKQQDKLAETTRLLAKLSEKIDQLSSLGVEVVIVSDFKTCT